MLLSLTWNQQQQQQCVPMVVNETDRDTIILCKTHPVRFRKQPLPLIIKDFLIPVNVYKP